MNQTERRALKILIEAGYDIEEDEFRRWCEEKRKERLRYYATTKELLKEKTIKEIVEDWVREYQSFYCPDYTDVINSGN